MKQKFYLELNKSKKQIPPDSRSFPRKVYRVILLLVVKLQDCKLGLCGCQFSLEIRELFMEMSNCTSTAIDRITNSSICLINHAPHCICSLPLREILNFFVINVTVNLKLRPKEIFYLVRTQLDKYRITITFTHRPFIGSAPAYTLLNKER